MKPEEISTGTALYEAALDLRFRLFFEEFGLSKSAVPDELEGNSIHLAIADQQELIGYARLSEIQHDEYRISQVVVEPGHRGKGYSTKLLRSLMKKAETLGARSIMLHSQLPVVGLYEKLGFKAVGRIYTVEITGQLHQKMVYHVNA